MDGGSRPTTARHRLRCAHSTVRDAARIGFVGDAYPMSFMLGDVRIDGDLPRGTALRAFRPHKDAAPDIFIAILLPERGRYRISRLAPATLENPSAGNDHGIQSDCPAPRLEHLQAVADDLLPDRPRLADMSWSSLFRISTRLAERTGTDDCSLLGMPRTSIRRPAARA